MGQTHDEWLHVRISERMHEMLASEAKRRQQKLSDFVREMIEGELSRRHAEQGVDTIRQAIAKELEPLKMMLRKIGEFSGAGAWEGFRILQMFAWLCNQQGSEDPYSDDYAEKILYDSALRAKVDFYSRHRIGAGSYEEYDAASAEAEQDQNGDVPQGDRALLESAD